MTKLTEIYEISGNVILMILKMSLKFQEMSEMSFKFTLLQRFSPCIKLLVILIPHSSFHSKNLIVSFGEARGDMSNSFKYLSLLRSWMSSSLI